MKNNNIKNYEIQKNLHQLIEDCEEYLMNFDSNHSSILSFFSSNLIVKEKYLDLLSKSYLNLFPINLFILSILLFIEIIQICFTFLNLDKNNKYRFRIIIVEIVTFIIILISFLIFLILKNLKKNKIFILLNSWIIFLLYVISIFVVMYNNNTCEKCIFISKFYTYFISSHILMIIMISANMSLHFGHFFIIGFLDFFLLIILNITNYKTNFYQYNASIIITAFFTILQSYKFELTIKKVFDFCIKKYYSYLINEESLENGDIGICLTTDDFEILKTNQTFVNNMSEVFDYDKEKNKNYLLYNLIFQINEKKLENGKKKYNLFEVAEQIINSYIQNGKQEKLEYFIPLGRFKIKQGTKLFSVKFKRVSIKSFNNNKKQLHKSDLNKNDIFDMNSTYKINLNVSKANSSSLNNSENILIPNFQDHDKLNTLYNYKFIFTLITNNRKLDRIKVEQIYQKLILTKVNHEFNSPVYFIQDLMDKLIKEKEDNEEKTINESKVALIAIEEEKSNKQSDVITKNKELFNDKKTVKYSSEKESQRRSLSSIKSNSEMYQYDTIETFLFIKYIAETIKLSSMDLTEYIKINSAIETSINELNVEIYTLSDIREYIEGIGNAYLNLMEKTINFITTMDSILTKRNIEIDKERFNQILSNLISNSIKNTNNTNGVIVNISKMKESDLKYFEFGANKDIFENNNYIIEINANEEITNDNDIELGLVISIEDSGTGISNSLLNDFNSEGETFYRVDTNDTKIHSAEGYIKCKGLGSGLKICKKLSDEMGIKLKCLVKPNNCGTIFKIYIKTELLYN